MTVFIKNTDSRAKFPGSEVPTNPQTSCVALDK